MGKIRKCGYTCCACYRIFSLLIKRYGHYFAVDITLTLSFVALLPLALREVAEK